MKLLLALFITLLGFSTFNVAAKDMLFVLSPYQDSVAAKQQYERLINFYFTLGAGDNLSVINGIDGTTVTTFKIPKNPAYNHVKTKFKINQVERNKLKAFCQNMRISNTNKSNSKSAIDMPRLMAQFARYANIANITDIVVIGSPLYDMKNNQGMSMAKELIPSDGYLLDKQPNNVFRTQGFESRLQGLRVHWLLPERLPRQIYAEAIQRFWHHFIHRQGGALVSFTHDSVMVFDLLRKNSEALPLTDTLDTSGKLEMQAIRNIDTTTSIYHKKINNTAATITNFMQPIRLGIQWQGDVDLDLFAKPINGHMLWYKHVSSPQGKHFKDVLSGASKGGTQYETIEFHHPVDIKKLFVAVNLYSVRGAAKTSTKGSIKTTDKTRNKRIKGTLRIQLLDKVYEAPFELMASAGNKGSDIATLINGSADTIFSKQFSVMDIVGLNHSNEVTL